LYYLSPPPLPSKFNRYIYLPELCKHHNLKNFLNTSVSIFSEQGHSLTQPQNSDQSQEI
jgi:hypothetical protein